MPMNPDDLPERPRDIREELAKAPRRRVDFVVDRESFNVYTLSDGSVLKLKVVLTGVKCIEGIRDAGGQKVYEPQFTVVSAVEEG